MAISFICPSCGHRGLVPDEYEGELRCRVCRTPFTVSATTARNGPSERPCEQCGSTPTYRLAWTLDGKTSDQQWLCEACERNRVDDLGRLDGTVLPTDVEFVVEVLDAEGQPTSRFLQVTEVSVVDRDGREVGRYRDAQALTDALVHARGPVKLIATETVGHP